MKFKDCISLSEQLTSQLSVKPGKDSIILSLTDGSLMTALHVAARLHGWMYPFITKDITDANRRLGVIAQNGAFYSAEYESDDTAVIAALHEKKSSALNALSAKAQSFGVSFDQKSVRGREIVLVADGLVDATIIMAACRFVHNLNAKAIFTLIGNASDIVAEIARSNSEVSVILDVVDTVHFNPLMQYQFTPDASVQDQIDFMKNIKTYWI